jgi:SAM-dependent methyltransferase
MSMKKHLEGDEDAFGRALKDRLAGEGGIEIIERSDGYIAVSSMDLDDYFAPIADWPAHHQWASHRCTGRVLDIGCGAGRFALHLQRQGNDVVAVDISLGAVEVCRERGVRDVRQLAVTDLGRELGRFDTLLLMGNNFGVLANRLRARRLLRRFRRLTAKGGRIIAEVLDPYRTREPLHFAYQEANRRRGRMPGQVRMRVRYKTYRTPWFDYLFVSQDELRALIEGTGWVLEEVHESGGPTYIAVLARSP